MGILEWCAPDVKRVAYGAGGGPGSDTSPANIYLLRKKYDIETAWRDGVLFRYYRGKIPSRQGYGFPLFAPARGETGWNGFFEDGGAEGQGGAKPPFDMGKALSLIRLDAEERGVKAGLCLCDERQRKAVEDFFDVDWLSWDGDTDYIYKRESLARLSGRKLHRKKNRANRFRNLYPEAVYRPITKTLFGDALRVAEGWFDAREETDDGLAELSQIRDAVANWDALGFTGGVLYVENEPVAMTMASPLSPQCLDVHYEKAVEPFAADGAYAVINQSFAASEEAAPYPYLNREEDMGVPGLRQAKNAYQPNLKLEKYYGAFR